MNEILKLSAKDEWRHCPGEDNPADIGSRGALGSKLKDEELWWKGPPWLTQEESSWPTSQAITSTSESQEEMKKTSTVMIVDVQDSASVAKVVDIERHGTLRKLLRVTAWVLRFVQNSKPRCAKRKGRLTREELINAENEKSSPARFEAPEKFSEFRNCVRASDGWRCSKMFWKVRAFRLRSRSTETNYPTERSRLHNKNNRRMS